MAETDVKNFNFEAFAKDLAAQASQVVPADIKPEDKEFVIGLIHRFCKMAGEALVKEENSKLNAFQASLITQFIGEWIFHKSIDIIRAGIELKYRTSILEKVAFTIYEVAKTAVEKDFPQEQMAQNMIEQKNQYTLALEQAKTMAMASPRHNLTEAIDELESDFNSMDENEAIEKLKSWIDNA